MPLRVLRGLSELAGSYDAFILDLWGLIHDGIRPYPGVVNALQNIKDAGISTILLSNAPRRNHALVASMKAMGIDRRLYDEVLSSGEATRDSLCTRDDAFFSILGDIAYHIGPERDLSVFEDTDIEIVDTLEQATFVVNTGPVEIHHGLEKYESILKKAKVQNLPMVCANPDKQVVRGGRHAICAGAIAGRYEEMGGHVGYRGKPDPAIYQLAAKKLGVSDVRRVAVVGDALETDVVGATRAGFDSIWCTGGIHAEELDVVYGQTADLLRAAALAEQYGCRPCGIIAGLEW